VIKANNTTSTLFIHPDASGFTNNGQLIVSALSNLTVQGLFNNLPNGTFTGGAYVVSGTLGVANSVVTNAANITLSGASAQISNTNTGTNALATLASNTSPGILSLQSGQMLTTSGNFSNAGTVNVATAGGFKAAAIPRPRGRQSSMVPSQHPPACYYKTVHCRGRAQSLLR
jgi:hypothetical protein